VKATALLSVGEKKRGKKRGGEAPPFPEPRRGRGNQEKKRRDGTECYRSWKKREKKNT